METIGYTDLEIIFTKSLQSIFKVLLYRNPELVGQPMQTGKRKEKQTRTITQFLKLLIWHYRV